MAPKSDYHHHGLDAPRNLSSAASDAAHNLLHTLDFPNGTAHVFSTKVGEERRLVVRVASGVAVTKEDLPRTFEGFEVVYGVLRPLSAW